MTDGMLTREGAIQYIGQNAPNYGVDPAAMLAVANHEGLNFVPIGGTWRIPGESGYNFGPPSWYSGGAGAAIINMQGSNAPAWSWSTAGLDYWMQQISNVASGLTGYSAIQSIVNNFERPAEKYRLGEIQNAWNDYTSFQQQIAAGGSQPPQTTTPVTGSESGGTTGSQQTGSQSVSSDQQSQGSESPTKFSFSQTIGHTVTQILLVMIGLALLLGGIYLIAGRPTIAVPKG